MPKISIICPVYNAEIYIERCVESIQNQSLSDWELILVNDKSTDNSKCVLTQLAERDKRIKVLEQEQNHGPMIARQRGIEKSEGEYILFCDIDDTLPNNALLKLYNKAIDNKSDIVCGGYNQILLDGRIIPFITRKEEYGKDSSELLKAIFARDVPQSLWAKLFKSSIVDKNMKVFDKMKNGEDAYVLFQIIENAHSVSYLDINVYNYYQTPNSSTQRRLNKRAIEDMFIVNAQKKALIEKYPHIKRQIVNNISESILSLYHMSYNNDGILDDLINKYQLRLICSNWSILLNQPITKAIVLIFKKKFTRSL